MDEDELDAQSQSTEEVEEETEEEELEDEGYDEEADAEEEEAETPVAARAVPASLAIAPTMSAEERAYAEEIFTPQQLAFMEGLTARAVSAAHQSYAVANSSVDAIMSDASPDYRRMVVPRINAVFSRMTPQQRADPHAADDALAVVMTEEARETGESMIAVMTRHIQMRGGTSPGSRPRAVIAPKPAAARAPSPTNASRGPVTRSPQGAPRNISLVAKTLGISVREAEQMGLE